MKKFFTLRTIFAIGLIAACFSMEVSAQLSYTTLASTYSQNFNNLIATGTQSVTGGNLNNMNTGLNGWYFSEAGSNANTTIITGTGSGTVGDTYSIGATSNSDRALGGLLSGSLTPTIGFYLTNNTGSTITSVDISYTGETWRVGAASRPDKMDFQYSTNATSLTTGTWTDFDALDYANPGQAMGNGSMLHSASISSSISSLSITNGNTIYIRWVDFNASGADDLMGVDDFSFVGNGTPPDPTITTISPNSATAGGAGFTLTVDGTNYISGSSTVNWNGSPRTTAFVNSTQLTATITGGDIASAGTANVTVVTSGAASPSNTATFTINAGGPSLSSTALTAFGAECINAGPYGPNSFTITGTSLTTADVTVGALSGFTYSTTSGGTYTTSLSLTQPGGAYSQDIFVKFDPTAVQSYSGNIAVGGGGATGINVAASGSGVDSAPTVTTGAASSITTSTATVAGQINDAGCSAVTAYGIEYSTSTGFTPGTGTQEPSTNLSGVNYSSALTGLSSCTNYYYRAYATNSAGTTYGTEGTFTTAAIAAPVATAGTSITDADFTANWGASAGAVDYRLDVYTKTIMVATDLFISEYVEGSGNNKYIEIFNGTGASVDLSDYELQVFSNGSGTVSIANPLSGTLADGATKVYSNSGATIYGGATTNESSVNFSGDDAFALYKVSTSSFVDIIGEIGVDPGTQWTDGTRSTLNQTLVRKATVSGGVTTNPTGLGFATLTSEWDNYATDDVSHLGAHAFNALVLNYVSGYNDRTVAGTSEAVTGLAPTTTYYYVVRAVGPSCTSAKSNEISVTTLALGCTDPLADNYDPNAVPANGTCTYCTATYTYNTPTPTPITIGSGIPDQNMAVAEDCHVFKVAMNAYERYVGAIVPTGNVYTTTTGYSPTSAGDPTPDPNNARWNFLVSVDLDTFDFTEVNVYMDLDFDAGTTPVYNTVDISALAISQGQGSFHVQQQAQNMKSAFWPLLFPGVSFDATIPGTYDLRIRIESPLTGAPMWSHSIQVVVEAPGCMDPLADNYDPNATLDDGSCTYCAPTITYNTPTPTPITIGSGIPDQNMAVSQDCRGIDVAMNAFERYVGAIIPVGNVYTTTTGNSPTSGGDPTPDPNNARWNILGSIDLGSFDFTEVNVFLDLDFDPGATPVWNTVNLSQGMIDNSMGGLHVYQASENLASAFWSIAFPGVTFDPDVPGIYDVRVRLESVYSNEELVNMAIQVVVEAPEVTYYSQATGSVSDPIWDVVPVGTAGPATFGTNANMVVQDTHTVTNTADVDVKDLTVETGGTLVLDNSATLSASGDNVDFSGTLTANDNSTLALLGTGGVTLASASPLSLWNLTANVPGDLTTDATLNIRGTLLLEDGDFDASTGALTLVSTSTGTGRLGPVGSGASFTGNMTVQRYIPAGHTNWRMLGSPVAGQTVNNWQDDFITAGYPGSAYPNFDQPVGSGILWPSVRYYDETNTFPVADTGVVGVTSNTQALTAGQGFFTWSGDNFSTTAAFTVDVTGAPNVASTPITLPMTYTSSGTPAADGWNLVSNPVPSPIAFDSISLGSDVAAQYWIFNPVNGTSQTYSAGIGQGNVNGKIQSSQGFWLQASGSNVTTTVSEADKVNEPIGGVFGGSLQAVRPIVRLFVASAINTYSDEATIVFDQGTPDLDAIDARKMPFHTVGAPLISARSTAGDNLAINFFGAYTTDISIPVTVEVDITGTYTISAGITGMQDLSCLSLEDLTTGTITPLTDGASYSFAINADDDANIPRFILHGTAPLPFYAENATCANTPNGMAAVVIDNGPVDVTWTDAFGTVLATQTGLSNVVAINDELAAGNYTVRVSPIGACGEVTTDFSIAAPALIQATENASQATSCPNSTDGSVNIEADGGTGELSFLWSDGTTGPQFTGAAGEQMVTITDETGCSMSTSFVVPAGEGAIAGFTAGAAVATEPVAFTNTSTMSSSWTWDFGDGSTSTDENPTHTYTLAGTYTVTLTATDGTCTDVFTMELTVDASTAIEAITPNGPLAVWATPDHIVIEHSFNNSPVDVDVYDATGRLAINRGSIVKSGRILINDRSLNTGVWFVRVKSGDVERTFRVPLIR